MSGLTEERRQRLCWLLALEVRRVVVGLDDRRNLLVSLWSKHRARDPLLETVFTRWHTLGFDHLLELQPEQVYALQRFYGTVEDLRMYFKYTEDMPTTLGDALDAFREDLRAQAEVALLALGVDEVQLPDAELGEGRELPGGAGDAAP